MDDGNPAAANMTEQADELLDGDPLWLGSHSGLLGDFARCCSHAEMTPEPGITHNSRRAGCVVIRPLRLCVLSRSRVCEVFGVVVWNIVAVMSVDVSMIRRAGHGTASRAAATGSKGEQSDQDDGQQNGTQWQFGLLGSDETHGDFLVEMRGGGWLLIPVSLRESRPDQRAAIPTPRLEWMESVIGATALRLPAPRPAEAVHRPDPWPRST